MPIIIDILVGVIYLESGVVDGKTAKVAFGEVCHIKNGRKNSTGEIIMKIVMRFLIGVNLVAISACGSYYCVAPLLKESRVG